MAKVEKLCVFCGKKPQDKNKEHIIPKWLIENTGDPNREAFFGFDITSDKPSMRTYAFNSFVFPACSGCNHEFSELESKAQSIVTSILQENELDAFDIHTLLDWLDKIRVGLWLGFLYLSKNLPDIRPRFQIRSRMRARDRFVIFYRVMNQRPGINFIGTESPSFHHIPSCFALQINDYCFFNCSNINLCDRRLGFPYAREAFYKGTESQIELDLVKGLERRFSPVIRKFCMPHGSKFYQPVFAEHIDDPERRKLYDTSYVRENSLDWESGIGKVFQETTDSGKEFPAFKNKGWIPKYKYPLSKFLPEINRQVYDYQLYTVLNAASMDHLKPKEKQWFERHIRFIKTANQMFVEFIEEQAKILDT